ncbi:ATP synthase subunit I [Staphylococcus americanisciuri]|uniref:ATP synthase subunit I n=1 Tax=Staphylococcus americanisciuri TaxID=2973940 RepID=A0ABT2F3I4_9STAP|nr:ATP synthase subunit I [Staphylococcus americanisciuri]MCS4487029.1 ATP synthase subunit I [Staphylococcus americanisciuri]
MKRFYNESQPFLNIYMAIIVILTMLNIVYHNTVVVGLLIGTLASIVNTAIFEYYLWRAQRQTTGSVSTGNGWRYLIALVTCIVWVLYQSQIHIIGVLIGLMISYALIVFRPLIKRG